MFVIEKDQNILAFSSGYWAPEYLSLKVVLLWHVGELLGAVAFL